MFVRLRTLLASNEPDLAAAITECDAMTPTSFDDDVQPRGNAMKKPSLLLGASAVALALALAGCATSGNNSGGGGGGGAASCEPPGTSPRLTNCTNKIKNDAPQVTVWAWYPNMAKVVDNFNDGHDDVQVCWTNAGQGGDEYDKFQTAISAGTGAPDVIMLEADRIPSFQVQDALVDLTDVGVRRRQGQLQRRRLEGRLGRRRASTAPRSTAARWA